MSRNSIYFQYYIFRVKPREGNTPEQLSSEILQTGIPLTVAQGIMPDSSIPGQICIDFDRLINQKVYESGSKEGCTKKAAELSAGRPGDLFCVVQVPDSYLSGKKDETNEKVGCVPFIKADFKLGKGGEWTIIPDLILEIYHSHGVVVANPDYNLDFLPEGFQFTKEQLNAMSNDQATVAWLSTRPKYTENAKRYDCDLKAFDNVKEYQAEVSKMLVASRNSLRKAYVPE